MRVEDERVEKECEFRSASRGGVQVEKEGREGVRMRMSE